MLVVGTLDPLLSDSELFAEALRQAGVPAELHDFAQMFALDMANGAIKRISAFARSPVS